MELADNQLVQETFTYSNEFILNRHLDVDLYAINLSVHLELSNLRGSLAASTSVEATFLQNLSNVRRNPQQGEEGEGEEACC